MDKDKSILFGDVIKLCYSFIGPWYYILEHYEISVNIGTYANHVLFKRSHLLFVLVPGRQCNWSIHELISGCRCKSALCKYIYCLHYL